jgi:hypothetical protein
MKAEFDPMHSAPAATAVLDFEKPLVELDRRIREVGCRLLNPAFRPRASTNIIHSFYELLSLIRDFWTVYHVLGCGHDAQVAPPCARGPGCRMQPTPTVCIARIVFCRKLTCVEVLGEAATQ